jgi:mono/diheme cytochrome c family protein
MKNLSILMTLAAVLLSACGAPQSSSSVDESLATLATVPPEYAGATNPFGAEAAETGAELYKTNCVACHGETGHGDGVAAPSLTPRPASLATLKETVTDDYLFWRISTGKAGTSMYGWKGVLAEDEIWQVVAFIRTLK